MAEGEWNKAVAEEKAINTDENSKSSLSFLDISKGECQKTSADTAVIAALKAAGAAAADLPDMILKGITKALDGKMYSLPNREDLEKTAAKAQELVDKAIAKLPDDLQMDFLAMGNIPVELPAKASDFNYTGKQLEFLKKHCGNNAVTAAFEFNKASTAMDKMDALNPPKPGNTPDLNLDDLLGPFRFPDPKLPELPPLPELPAPPGLLDLPPIFLPPPPGCPDLRLPPFQTRPKK